MSAKTRVPTNSRALRSGASCSHVRANSDTNGSRLIERFGERSALLVAKSGCPQEGGSSWSHVRASANYVSGLLRRLLGPLYAGAATSSRLTARRAATLSSRLGDGGS